MRHWWFSCDKFTIFVETDGKNRITAKSAPISRRFWGQPVRNLVNWMKMLGNFKYHEYVGARSNEN